MPVSLVALVEIGPDDIWVLLLALFLLIAAIALIAWVIVLAAKRKAGTGGVSAWDMNGTFSLPVSKPTFDRVSAAVAKGLERPTVTPEARAAIDGLSRYRKPFSHVYRGLLAFAGGLGLLVAYRLYADATPANMQLLPAAIFALLAAGALLSALIPSRTITGDIEPIDPRLLDKIQVTVERPAETAFTLDQTKLDLAAGLFAEGWDADNVARAAFPDYDGQSDQIKRALQSMLREAVIRSKVK